AALEGARPVARSRYLLAIVTIVGLYEIVSQLMDFQFKATTSHFLGADEIDAHLATVYAITNWTALAVQLFATSFVMTRFGVTAALLVLPLAALGGSAAFLLLPALWTGSFLSIAD